MRDGEFFNDTIIWEPPCLRRLACSDDAQCEIIKGCLLDSMVRRSSFWELCLET